ncbi:MAG: MBL fold metallo-hydrolase [Candidatus Lernaella stagnicola]|nr:MBL fold metallo-hydrolase [Candidatus Lernaella stagnicola]
MKIRWNGHSSFTVTADDGTVIVTDPYEPGAFGGGIGYQQITDQPDIVTISHDHADHNFTDGFQNDFVVIRDGGEAKGIHFTAVNSFHDENEGAERGTNTIFVFVVDGVRLCHLGDLGHILSDDQIEAIGQVDALMTPVGGYFTVDPLQATDAVERINPKIVLPMHFKTDKCGFPIAEVAEFLIGKENVKQIDADEIEVSADRLPGAREIIVLRHRY